MSNAQKRVLLVLVEGKTDCESFCVPFESFLDCYAPSVRASFITLEDERDPNGDLTSRPGVSKKNIVSNLYSKYILPSLNRDFMDPNDLLRIVHIVDTDGAYIPDDRIIRSDEHKNPMYCDDCILTTNPHYLISRNISKQENLQVLIDQREIRFGRLIPYSVYYCSCNLEHYLYGVRNMSLSNKRIKPEEFMIEYGNDPKRFVDFMTNNQHVTSGLTYEESWKYIKHDLNSLSRCSNLNLLIEGIVNGSLI